MTSSANYFLGNSLAPMPGKMMEMDPDQRPGLDALEKWCRDYCLHRVIKKLGQAAWASMALQVGAVTSVHNPVVASAMVSKSRDIAAATKSLDTASAQQAAVDGFFEALTPPVVPDLPQSPQTSVEQILPAPSQLPSHNVPVITGQRQITSPGQESVHQATPLTMEQPRSLNTSVVTDERGYMPLTQPGYPVNQVGVPVTMVSQPSAVPTTFPAPTQVPHVPAMMSPMVYPGTSGQHGNLYPVLTQSGYFYVMFPPGMLPPPPQQQLQPQYHQQPLPSNVMYSPYQSHAEALTQTPPAIPVFPPSTAQTTSQAFTGYPPAMLSPQQAPLQPTPVVSQTQLVTPPFYGGLNDGVKRDEATLSSQPAGGQLNDQTVAEIVSAEPSKVSAEMLSSASTMPVNQTNIEPRDPVVLPQYRADPVSMPTNADTLKASSQISTVEDLKNKPTTANPRGPSGDDLQFKSPLGSSSNFAMDLMKSLNTPTGNAVLSGIAAHSHHQHIASPPPPPLQGPPSQHHGLQNVFHRQVHTQNTVPPSVPATTTPAPALGGEEPPPLAVSEIEHLFPNREAAERAAANPTYRKVWYMQQAQFAMTRQIMMGQFAAGNAALQAQNASFNTWKTGFNAQNAAYQQGLQHRIDAHRINDANRHLDAQAFSLAVQGNTVLEVPYGGGTPRFAGGNQLNADGDLYVMGDPNRIVMK
jgi:hypothetical protein